MGEDECLSKRACLPLLTSCLEGVAGDMVVKAEGGVEDAALPPPGVVGPLAPIELLLLACASESMDSDDELLDRR